MSQHDYDISNQAFAATRADMNLALLALASNNSGPTAPATTFAYMWWPDTTTDILKQRNGGNSAWVSILTMSTGLPVGAAASGANSDITSLAAPALAGATATTQAATDSSTKVATTAFTRGFRQLAQVVTFQTGAVATGTATIPTDNTIPQSTEGDQYMSLAVTPTNALSTIEIDVTWCGSNSVAANTPAVALFQDSSVNALAVGAQTIPTGGYLSTTVFKHVMVAGTTSATTFKIRAGGGTAGTTTFNGSAGGQLYGGVTASRITIKEYLP